MHLNHEGTWRNFTARTASSSCTGTNTDLTSSPELPPALCSLLCSPGQTHKRPNHAHSWGQAVGCHLTVNSKDGYILELTLHCHADAGLCLNKQVGKCSVSVILTHLTPQEFHTAREGCTNKRGIWLWRQLTMHRQEKQIQRKAEHTSCSVPPVFTPEILLAGSSTLSLLLSSYEQTLLLASLLKWIMWVNDN